MSINLTIKELRKRKLLSQEALAGKLGLTKGAISSYETGNAMPSLETAVSMCDLFGVSLDYLVRGRNFTQVKSASHTDEYVTAIKEDLIELQKARINTLEKLIRRHCPEAAELAF